MERIQIISTQEVAELLECKPRRVHYLIELGKLKPIREFDRFKIFSKEEVLNYKNGGNGAEK